jgi:GNAT superfamily N-acetyltransferase
MYTYRAATAEDVDPIARFIEQVITTSVDASATEKEAFVVNTRKNLSKWLEAPDLSFHLVALAGSHLVGVVLVREFWNLCHLFVAPECQSSGLGRALLQQAVAACTGKSPYGALRLNSSRNALGFYLHFGFVKPAGKTASHGAIPLELSV